MYFSFFHKAWRQTCQDWHDSSTLHRSQGPCVPLSVLVGSPSMASIPKATPWHKKDTAAPTVTCAFQYTRRERQSVSGSWLYSGPLKYLLTLLFASHGGIQLWGELGSVISVFWPWASQTFCSRKERTDIVGQLAISDTPTFIKKITERFRKHSKAPICILQTQKSVSGKCKDSLYFRS